MIGTIRKHSKSLWWIVIVVTIFGFVIWGSKTGNNGGARGEGDYGSMNGQPITPIMFADASREARLSYAYNYLQSTGRWPGLGANLPGMDLEGNTYQRLFLLQKAKELGIQVDPDAVAQAAGIRMRALFRGNTVPVAEFEKQVLSPERLTLDDFERYIRNDLVIQQLISVIGLGGQLVPPQEVQSLYRRDFQELALQAAFFHGASNLASVIVTPEKLGEFWTNQESRYRLPERVQVSYVSFPISNYLAEAKVQMDQVTNLNEIIDARLEELGTNYLSLGATPEAAKEKMRAEALKNFAKKSADDAAKKFDNLLYDKSNKALLTPADFATLATESNLTAEVTAPFSRDEPPAGLDVGADFIKKAFKLTPEDALCEPIAGENHLYVIAFNRRLPSEQPSFESVRDRVSKDFRFMEARTKAQQQAIAFHSTATNGLAAGKSFSELCTQAGVKPLTLPPVSLSTRSLPEVDQIIDISSLKRVAFATPPGQVGQILPSADGAVVLYVQARLPLDETVMKTNLPAFNHQVQLVRREEVFNEWFRHEAEPVFRNIPYYQRKQQAQMNGAPAN